MSIKHRVKDRAANGKMRPVFRIDETRFTNRPYDGLQCNLGKSPSWFTREFNNRPKRKEAAQVCRLIVNGYQDAETAAFPLATKPKYYYW